MRPVPPIPTETRLAVEAQLSERFGERVQVVSEKYLHRSLTFRCRLDSASGTVPDTVTLRLARKDASQLNHERRALEHLNRMGNGVAPRFFAGSSEAGFLVLEDLGSSYSLHDVLMGEDTERVNHALLAFAQSLGTLHAQTFSRGGVGISPAPLPLAARWEHAQAIVVQHDLPIPWWIDEDLAQIASLLAGEDGCLALSSGDPFVTNVRFAESDVLFFDFEAACVRHPLIDAAALRIFYFTRGFGTAWQLPEDTVRQMEAVYRTELAGVYAAFNEDAVYEAAMVAAGFLWGIEHISHLQNANAELSPDNRTVLILENAVASARRVHRFLALADWAEQVAQELRSRSAKANQLPFLHPAFAEASLP